MPELIAKSPLSGIGAVAHGGLRLAQHLPGQITSIAILPGQEKAVARGLKPLGLGFPKPNTFTTTGSATLVWTARDQAFLIGIAPPEMTGAALTDQTDGWAVLRLDGPSADEMLMRVYPLDLRVRAFPVGCGARAPLNHMPSILARSAPHVFDIMVFRSMARTAWHELEVCMKMLAARAALG